jgi:hypothetical protein
MGFIIKLRKGVCRGCMTGTSDGLNHSEDRNATLGFRDFPPFPSMEAYYARPMFTWRLSVGFSMIRFIVYLKSSSTLEGTEPDGAVTSFCFEGYWKQLSAPRGRAPQQEPADMA